ncbi:predicted protein [Postia placenta Mad-698-R]|uniref:Uncharacterized protein n=1 Tax=Postia placenta MAD-698-R-SB12 TaxID=670580 RepID=A0A1X6MKW4_9APHY|nr:hypothetical protein POSPLADRAFT_1157978 [Postia placenta MAD-698-R-SB12]EED84651.1 predicted protein [Postia placenta Mad-698-R]OSX56929.1 hypothetical protein POSPLADRAFT_1157978 [Postia placenta MAD-698-R-SB12]
MVTDYEGRACRCGSKSEWRTRGERRAYVSRGTECDRKTVDGAMKDRRKGALFFSRAQWMRVYQARVERASRMREERECGSHAQRKQSWINYAPVREKRTPVSPTTTFACLFVEGTAAPQMVHLLLPCMTHDLIFRSRERVCIGESGPAFSKDVDELREDCSEEGVVAEGAAWSMGGRCIEDVTTE